MLDKNILRKKYLSIRKNIKEKDIKSHLIFKRLIEDNDYKNAKAIAFYKSLESEVSTEELIIYSFDNGKDVLLPKVDEFGLKFYKITEDELLIKSKFGVKEPIGEISNLIENIDLMIVPGVCFDHERNRIGFGKGYYDRTLANKNIKTIAIAFDDQIIKDEKIPIDKYDIQVDKIITENNIY